MSKFRKRNVLLTWDQESVLLRQFEIVFNELREAA